MSAISADVNKSHDVDRVHRDRRPTAALLAAFLPVAAALLMVGEVLTPSGLDKPTTTVPAVMNALTIAASHSSRLYASNLLVIFGLGALGVSFVAIATLAGKRDAAVATSAAVIGGFAAFCGALTNMLVGFNVAAAVTAHTTTVAATQVLVSADTSAVSTLLLIGYLGGGLLAILLLTTALWRSRTVPRWLPILFGLGLIVAAASRPGIGAVAVQLPFAVAMFILASRIWQDPHARPDER